MANFLMKKKNDENIFSLYISIFRSRKTAMTEFLAAI